MIPMMAVRIFRKILWRRCVGHVGRGFPRLTEETFYGQKWRRTTKKSVEGESGRKRENTSRIYISSEDVQRLKGSRQDCKMIFQARTEEK